MRTHKVKIIRKCVNCGKEFETYTKPHKKYCSAKCKNHIKNQKAKESTSFVCDYCGKIFKGYKRKIHLAKHHFCCEEHSKKWRKQNEKMPNHICAICGKKFYSSHKKAKTCSTICGNRLATHTRANFSKEREETRKLKEYLTKKKNNTFNTSKDEEYIYNQLTKKFKAILRQYKSEKYPFRCDFYIPALDLYIEYQGTWSHGKYKRELLGAFDKRNNKHIRIYNMWKEKAIYSKQYKQALNTWTIRDPLKRQTAKQNNLNWIEFFTIKEFENWFKNLP